MTRNLHLVRLNESLGNTTELNGQYYSLDMQEMIDEAAERQRLEAVAAEHVTELVMQNQDITQADKNAVISELAYKADQLKMLTKYCISRGLFEEEFEATAA